MFIYWWVRNNLFVRLWEKNKWTIVSATVDSIFREAGIKITSETEILGHYGM